MSRPRRSRHRIKLVRVAALQSELLRYIAQDRSTEVKTEEPPVPKRTTNKLTNKEVFLLYKWVEENVASLPAGINRVQAARAARDALGFELNENHLDGALEATGRSLPLPADTVLDRLAKLEEAVAELRREMDYSNSWRTSLRGEPGNG